jgi:tight adherence protein B
MLMPLIAVVFIASLWLAYLVLSRFMAPRLSIAERLEALAAREGDGPDTAGRWSALPGADRLMTGTKIGPAIEQLLDDADLPMKPFEFLLLVVVAGLGLLAAAVVTRRDPLVAVALGAFGVLIPILWVRARRAGRRDAFNQQIPDALQAVAATLRAGYGFSHGMAVVGSDLPKPISVEFARAQREMNLGLTVEEVLQAMARRMQSRDFDLAVSGILINRQVGGNLAELLDQISTTIRERVKLQTFIRVLTAEQRLSAIIIMAVPPVLMVILLIAWREYMSYLLLTRVGQLLLAVAVVMQLIGVFFIRRIVAIEV